MTRRAKTDDEDFPNNLVVAGALFALLQSHVAATDVGGPLTAIEVVTDENGVTNQLDITLAFMASSYRITVERNGEV